MSWEQTDPPSPRDDWDAGAYEDNYRELIQLEKEQEHGHSN